MTNQVKQCKTCRAAIIWGTMQASQQPMPLDAVPTLTGTFFLSPSGQCVHWESSGEFAQTSRANGSPKYTSHFATCPERDQHRKAAK